MDPKLEKFYGDPTTTRRTSEGDVDFPIKYFDASMVTALYLIEPADAAWLLKEKNLVPARFIGGRSVAAITWFEYRDTSIGAYNELSIGVFAGYGESPLFPLIKLLQPKAPVGVHILHLPVTTSIAWAAGCETWGYPKIVAALPYIWRTDGLRADLVDGGKPVFSMNMPVKPGLRVPLTPLKTLSVLDGKVILTVIATNGTGTFHSGKGTSLKIENKNHPIAQTLTGLNLPPEPKWILHSNPMRTVLPLGDVIGEV